MSTCEVSYAIGKFHTDPNGNPLHGWFFLSMIFWFNLPLHYFFSRLRSVLFQMSPSDISSYLSTNILAIGISSITPMMYLSMETVKCANNAGRTLNAQDQCSGITLPKFSICVFLLIMMVAKVVIAPLSTSTITANDLIKLNLPHRTIFQGALSGLSFLLNFYLFANMEEGTATTGILPIAVTAEVLALVPLFLEFFRMVLHRDHRTSFSPPPECSLTSHTSSEMPPTDSLSRDPTQSGATNAFV